MGVDISLHIEIRRRDKWQLMVIESPLFEKNNEFPIFDTEVYSCRYYHFNEFLEEAPSRTRNKKDILSTELQQKLDEDDSFGTFMFDDLEKHCDKLEKLLISGIAHAGIYSIKEQLDRIEKKLDGGELEKEIESELASSQTSNRCLANCSKNVSKSLRALSHTEMSRDGCITE